MARTVHIVGAGVAGLAAAVRLSGRGIATVVHEATDQAGGRCRSYDDAASGMRIDNGTHILLSGNTAALDFVATIGAQAMLTAAAAAQFPFIDLAADERWTLDLGSGRLPFWVFDRRKRAPATRARDYIGLGRLMLPGPDRLLAETISCRGTPYERVMRPFLLAALNTEPSESSAALARAVVRDTIARGGQACRPSLAPAGLSAAFVEPACAYVEVRGGSFRFAHQLRRLIMNGDAVAGLDFGSDAVAVGAKDAVVIAVPPYSATAVMPGLRAPDAFHAIVNAHFRIVPPADLPPMLGVLNGVAEWIFAFPDRISVTISCADRLLHHARDQLAAMIWEDVRRVAQVPVELPPWQIVRERRATFAATPSQNAKRPGARTAWRNLFLAGDWTDTGLPATIESAVRSGRRAADLVMET